MPAPIACQLDAAAHGEGGHVAKLREDQVEREVVAAIASHARGTGHELARRLESYAAVCTQGRVVVTPRREWRRVRLMVGVVVAVPAIEQLDAPIVARGPSHTHERLPADGGVVGGAPHDQLEGEAPSLPWRRSCCSRR